MSLSCLLLNILGFTIDPSFIKAFSKQRIGIFPHTSLCETGILLLTMWATNSRGKACFAVTRRFMESSITGPFLRYFGGFSVIPGSGVTKSTIEYLKEHPDVSLAISPEGSLSPREWKTGFFYIARELQIPIVVFGIDFEKHIIRCHLDEEIIIGPEETPELKMDDIKTMFSRSGIVPLFPENSNPRINGSEGKITSYIPFQGKILLLNSTVVIICIIYFFYK
jgi:lysophospholipid acyltransferase (LPLAT)-like uncharacterized protein